MPQSQIFSSQEIDLLRESGRILRGCLEHVRTLVRPGITTKQLDDAAEAYIRERKGVPAFEGYRGFPATLCISLNEECVHGIPGSRVVAEGDIVSLDGGVIYEGYYSDACITVPVGPVSAEAQRLLDVTSSALEAGVAVVRGGMRVGDISQAVQSVVEEGGFTVIAALTGHGVGAAVHQFPDIPNIWKAGTGPILPAGAVIAIEPIVSAGSGDIREMPDHWTLVSADHSLTAHFGHTVLLTATGHEILA